MEFAAGNEYAIGAHALGNRMERGNTDCGNAGTFNLLCQRSAATRAGASSRGQNHPRYAPAL
jgi:hypothetical protein